ncbi:MAG: N-acetyltransferase [Crocinitomicaceae bacterium]|nr:N-acetyltransferase [Crocinitomicaceae bacterium]
MIRPAAKTDAQQLADLYNYYVRNTLITFEEEELSAAQFAERIQKISENYPFIVFEEAGEILGFAYGNKWRERSAYRFALESSVYVKQGYFGKQIGTQLYQELFSLLKSQGCKQLIGVITLPNDTSVKMHERMGFEKAAHFKKVGYKFGQWCDVGYWQKTL